MAGPLADQGYFARRGGKFRRKPMAEINVTPFVDVMLVLLIVFMVTAPLLSGSRRPAENQGGDPERYRGAAGRQHRQQGHRLSSEKGGAA